MAAMDVDISEDAKAQQQISGDFQIKPENSKPKLNSQDWPLLLKNAEKMNCLTNHFTSVPVGCSPLQRDIRSYVKAGCINANYF